jgi:hypothetical protein
MNLPDWFDTKRKALTVVLIIAALIVGFTFLSRAHAADKGAQGKIAANDQTILPDLSNLKVAGSPWTGLYVGAYGGHAWNDANATEHGDPVSSSQTGWLALGALGFNVQSGKLVFGPEVSYGWIFGELNDNGNDNILNVGGRAGVLANDNLLFYGHASWSRLYTGIGNVDGWQVGPGLEMKIPGTKLSLDFRYAYGQWDVPDYACFEDIESTSHAVLAGIKLNF